MGYTVMFRGHVACPCLAEWYPVHEAELRRRGILSPNQQIDIFQLIGLAEASADTHSEGGAGDDDQISDEAVWVARQMGAPATWARVTGSFANNKHRHLVLNGCPHNGPARYQIAEVFNGGDGLVGSAPDPGPRPIPDRTWRQGIAWALEQGDDMASPEVQAQLDRIEATAEQTLKEQRAFRQASAEKTKAIRKALVQLERESADGATRKQVQRVIDLLDADE